MLELVGLPTDLFANKSGRATFITRMAAQGVPNEVRMLISDHHTSDGYHRHDRTKQVKLETTAACFCKA